MPRPMGELSARLKRGFHRAVWQRLPRTWRRETLFRATALSAPRPEPAAVPALPIVVVGALRTASGLGASARLACRALHEAGLPVYGIDLSRALMQTEDLEPPAFADGREVVGAGTLVLHVNAPLMPLAMAQLGRRLVRGKHVVGYWAWELPEVPEDWRYGAPFVHQVWVPSRFVADAVRPVVGGRPVRVVPHPVAVDATAMLRPPDDAEGIFTVLVIFNMASSFARKNPLAAITAFDLAFADDPTTRLVIKLSNPEAFPLGRAWIADAVAGRANVTVVDATLDATGMVDLYASADAVLSLHRAEGFGLVPAEAMLYGLPVVATDWSGTTDFLTAETGMPVGYRLVPARDPQWTYHRPGTVWAEPDLAAAARALRRLRDEPMVAQRLGFAAAAAMRQLDATAYAGIVCANLGLDAATG